MSETASVEKKKGKHRPFIWWRRARKIVQAAALIGFFILVSAAHSSDWSTSLLNFPIRISPLVILSEAIASRSLISGSLVAILLLISALLVGRGWCGWICPMGTVLDWISPRRRRENLKHPPENLRALKYGILITILTAALWGNLTLLVLDPLTLLYRSLSNAILPAFDQIITVVEVGLSRVGWLAPIVNGIDPFLRPFFFPYQPLAIHNAFVFGLIFCGVIGLNWIAPRFWCRYLCPLGALLGLLSKFALVRREVGEDCRNCALCQDACPTGTIDPERAYASDPSECTLCLDCLDACPRSTIRLVRKFRVARWRAYDPNRRVFLTSIAASAAGTALLASETRHQRSTSFLLRPPGTNNDYILDHCIRCGLCVRTCPTSALQADWGTSGFEGLWSPLLVPRAGYCDYSCTACGEICPVQAIPRLDLATKRVQIIGKAFVDENRCIAWAEHTDCIVCEEMCPLPQKAIYLEEQQAMNQAGQTTRVKVPIVNRELCIGCGICEYKCPVSGDAAIRVYIYTAG